MLKSGAPSQGSDEPGLGARLLVSLWERWWLQGFCCWRDAAKVLAFAACSFMKFSMCGTYSKGRSQDLWFQLYSRHQNNFEKSCSMQIMSLS